MYFACKDLHLCEVSAAFSLALETVPVQQQAGGQQVKEARLKVSLSGISSSSSSQE